MKRVLTPFQLWCLFRMYGDPDSKFTTRRLLLECCESSLKTLSEDDTDKQLSDLLSMGYASRKEFRAVDSVFWISNNGILYVRKNLAAINNACEQNLISESVINAQDDDVAKALHNKDSDLKNTIINTGIKNIGNIPMLIEHTLQFVN